MAPASERDAEQALGRAALICGRVREACAKTVVGQDNAVESLLTAALAGGHCLLEGAPGLAKTLMVRTLAAALGLKFSRVQFTPDLMPSDVTGTEVLREDRLAGTRHFEFSPGPIFAQVVLADEINRAPPKTQAALLEAMAERQVTAGGASRHLPTPFMVLATQNPIEQEGTYPLPEAQLDRFMFHVRVDYPSAEEEYRIVEATTRAPVPPPGPACGADDVLELQALVRDLPASPHVIRLATRLARATRPDSAEAPAFVRDSLSWGAGPRAGQSLVLAAKARALQRGRPYPSVEDVRGLAGAVLRHRIVLNFRARSEGLTPDAIVRRLADSTPAEE